VPLPELGASRAILVGVSDFKGDPSLTPIPAARNNLTDMAKVLTDSRLLGLSAEHCVVIPDPPSAEDVTRPILRLAEEAQDTLIFYYAGHGLIDDHDAALVLAVGNTVAREAQFSGLSYDLLRSAIRRVRARRIIVILDCCFSGRAIAAMADIESVVTGQLDIDGTYILTSSSATKPSIAPTGARHTAFTGCLLDIFRRGIPGGSQFLQLAEIYQRLLPTMMSAGYPLPKQQGVNNIESLALVRNVAWRAGEPYAMPRARQPDKVIHRLAIASMGAKRAVAAASAALGPGGVDTMTAMGEVEVPKEDRQGFGLVSELASTMRTQFGDGAATAVTVAGSLLAGIHDVVAAGADPIALSAGLEHSVDYVCGCLSDLATPCDDVTAPLRTAFGDDGIVNLIAKAASSVGPSNVETIMKSGDSASLEITSRLTLTTNIISPNGLATPVSLADPYVVVVPDVTLDAKSLRPLGDGRFPSLLLITPHRSVSGLRAILHSFKKIVIVRVISTEEWAHLGAALELLLGRPPLAGMALRVLITDSSTTIVGRGDFRIGDTGHARVHVGEDAGSRAVLARRALLVAQASVNGGVLAGGGAALYGASRMVARQFAGDLDRQAIDVFCTAISEPLRQLARNAVKDPDAVCAALADRPARYGLNVRTGSIADLAEMGVVDPVPIVQGALRHALATVVRLLAEG